MTRRRPSRAQVGLFAAWFWGLAFVWGWLDMEAESLIVGMLAVAYSLCWYWYDEARAYLEARGKW